MKLGFHIRLLTFASVFGLWGCASPDLPPASLATLRAGLYGRATIEFNMGVLYKPSFLNAETLAARLAPLFIEEVSTNDQRSIWQQERSERHAADRTNPPRPTVYAQEGEVFIGGQSHTQVIYVWWPSPSAMRDGSTFQGIRMILDSTGQPVIWEVLDQDQVRRIFVAESLEKAAAAQFGAPLPGRRHAVEPSLDAQPQVIAARVLDDGPVPMGPIVYLQTKPQAVSTVACRCMAVQVRAVVDSRDYDLRPLEGLLLEFDLAPTTAARIEKQIQPVLRNETAASHLELYLRLPKVF